MHNSCVIEERALDDELGLSLEQSTLQPPQHGAEVLLYLLSPENWSNIPSLFRTLPTTTPLHSLSQPCHHATRSSGYYTTGPRYLDFPPSSFPHLCHKNSKHESARDISSSHSWQRVKHSEERYYSTPLQQYSKTVLDCCFITSSNTPSFALETLEVDSHSKKPQLSSRSRWASPGKRGPLAVYQKFTWQECLPW